MEKIKAQVEKAVTAVKEVVTPTAPTETKPAEAKSVDPNKPKVVMVVGQRVEPK